MEYYKSLRTNFMQWSNDYCPSTGDALKLFSFNDENGLH